MESEGLARATLNQEVTVLDEDGEWAHVIFDGKEGFMKTEFLEKTTGGLASSKTTGISSPSGNGYEMKLYMETPNPGGSITIQYSYFSGTKANELNALVEKAVQETIKKHTDSMIYEYPMTLNYQVAVTLNNDNMVSIVFWGWCNWGSSDGIGKDFSDLVTLNIDLSTMEAVTFADLYRVDSAFVDIFFSKSYFPSDPVTSYSKVLFPEMLAMQKNVQPFSISNNVQCFLKPDGIVLSMTAASASTGSDNFEAQLDYAEIQRFYLPAKNYW